MVTIVFAHPSRDSFNAAILDAALKGLEKKEKSGQVIDLYADGFNPVLTAEELKVYNDGGYIDPLVKKYQEMISNSDELVFIFPIWWYDVPAILKGFLDKILLSGFAYEVTPLGIKALLTHIRRATVITASLSPAWMLKCFFGNPIKRVLINATLKSVGIKNCKWLNSSAPSANSRDKCRVFLEKVKVCI